MDIKAFEEFCTNEKIEYRTEEPMRNHTSFKIGGPASLFIEPKNTDELCLLMTAIKKFEIPYFVIGNGSNILVSDKGIEGAVISLSKINSIEVNGEYITAGAGASLAGVCAAARDNSLSGLEFAYGIPGCAGGSLYMNAGAYNGEISQAVDSCKFITSEGITEEISKNDMNFGYRKSIFRGSDMIITSVKYRLKKGDKEKINALMEDYMEKRKAKQPLEFPSAGSTFKRPEGNFAGALIEKNNLKGVTVGGAMVSPKHAGFLINCGSATCEDVKKLIELVKETVFKADGVMLEPEIIFVGKE